ncbi:serine/threonine-protein kinase VRK3 isoform X2 [Antennarius striatus]
MFKQQSRPNYPCCPYCGKTLEPDYRMPFHFCSHCGTKLGNDYKFCPSCGKRIPCSGVESRSVSTATSSSHSALKSNNHVESSNVTSPVTARPALQKSRYSLRLEREVESNNKDELLPPTDPVQHGGIEAIDRNAGLVRTPPRQKSVDFTQDKAVGPTPGSPFSPVGKSPRSVKGKAKLSSPTLNRVEKEKRLSRKTEESVSSPVSRSPSKGGRRAKKAKQTPPMKPLPEGEELTDTMSKKWKLVKLCSQSTTEMFYEVSRCGSKESNHILKLGAKDGKIFNEQNFLQRAAKPASVDKWIKQNQMDFLGIPSCVGFGLHADSYRFLIFPNMGQSLQSIMGEDELLSEKTVLQLACRILDVLQYIHSNEYVHADINAENIYVTQEKKPQVYLVGYCHAFRFCPGGIHVEYREASRAPHDDNVELISLDVHRGAAPSRRGDLQSLGYCMLRWHTGTLPWTALHHPDRVATEKQRFMEDVPALLSHCFGGKKVSSAFYSYLTTVMTVQYSEQPDYSALKASLRASLLQLGGSLEQPLRF